MVFLELDTIGSPASSSLSEVKKWQGGDGFVMCVFPAGSGTIALQVQEETTETWLSTDISFRTCEGVQVFSLPSGIPFRISLSDGVAAEARVTVLATPRKNVLAA